MATHSSKITLRAKWRRGWELMWAGKTTEGCDLLSGITVADLPMVANADEPEKLLAKIEAIIGRHAQVDEFGNVMDILILAAKQGDQEASELLVFGDLSARWGWPGVAPAAIPTD